MNVLVAIDFSEVSERQLETVGGLVRRESRKVYLLHVAEPEPDFVGFEAGPEVVRDQMAAQYHREHKQLHDMAQKLRATGHDVTPLLVQGATVETILGEAEKLDAGLIVVGSHGHGAAFDLIVGSVSADVIRKANVPVLVVPSAER